MRCKNCGRKVKPGRYCTGCGMMQPPRVAKGLKVAVGVLGTLAVVLLLAVGYVVFVLEADRFTEPEQPQRLADLHDVTKSDSSKTEKPKKEETAKAEALEEEDTAEGAASEPEQTVQQSQPAAADEDSRSVPELPETEQQPSVDDEVKQIRSEYDQIEKNRQADRYDTISLRQSVTAWADGTQPVCIMLRDGADGIDFTRSYYFTDGFLRFAMLEADDACRLYFKDDVLLRLRYAADASKATNSVAYDGLDGDEGYDAWREFAMQEAYALYAETQLAAQERSEFILPDSSSRYLERKELTRLTKDECRLARNEIFARHGRRFADTALQAYFDGCSWYTGTTDPADFSESVFNEYEAANVALIRQYESEMGYR